MKREPQDCKLPITWKQIPILYAYVFQYMLTKVSFTSTSQEVSIRFILEMWHRHIYHLPRVYDLYIVKEFEEYGLVEQIAPGRYLIKGAETDLVVKRLKFGACLPKNGNGAPYLYLHIFRKMMGIFGRKNCYISGTQIMKVWRTFIPNVARIYDNQILEEMCRFELLRKINSQRYVFLGSTSFGKLKKLDSGKTILW